MLEGGTVQVPYNATVRVMLASLERNLIPDLLLRRLTRLLLATRLRSGYKPSSQLQLSDLLHFAHSLKEMPIAIKTDKPKQHYELPIAFFNLDSILANILYCSGRTLRIQQWGRMDGFSFPIQEEMKCSSSFCRQNKCSGIGSEGYVVRCNM